MALTQVQIIQSLGDALTWFEKELSWGVAPAELRHLTGRIGELYAAMITRGQMALAVNQPGYDVVSAEGERISVKTITTATHVSFNEATFGQIDRVMILRMNVEEGSASIEELLDCTVVEALEGSRRSRGALHIHLRERALPDLSHLRTVLEGSCGDISIRQLENGTILVRRNGVTVSPALPVLREVSRRIGVDILNAAGNPKNTRTLGGDILTALNASAA